MNTIAKKLEAQFDVSFRMLLSLIEVCPDALWHERVGGFRFWQQVLHALCGAAYWLRLDSATFSEPFPERRLFPELDCESEGSVSKQEMRDYAATVAARAGRFFASLDSAAGPETPSHANAELSTFDVATGQIRHLMYHVGHCDALLRERGIACAPWLEVGALAS